MPAERKPAIPKPSTQSALKTLHRKALKINGGLPLKVFVRQCVTSPDQELKQKATDWFHNKGANFSKPPLGLGSTRKKKSQQQQSGGKKK